MDFNELKENIISSNWTKIGSKFNTPVLSIFPNNIKEDIEEESYEMFKNYFFEDDTHNFKIQSLMKDDKPFFVIFAKSKNPIVEKQISKKGNSAGKYKYTTAFDQKQIALIIAIAIVIISSIALAGPILKVIVG